MCACVRACYRACLVLSDPGEIGALASASIVLCILKGHWGVGGVEMRLPLVPSGPDFTPWSTSASPLQIWPDCHLGWHRKGAGQHPGRFGLGWRWRSTAAETSAHGLGQVWASIPGYPGRPSMVSCSFFHWISWWALLCHTVMVLVQHRHDKVTKAGFWTEIRRRTRAAGAHAKVTFQLKYQQWVSGPFQHLEHRRDTFLMFTCDEFQVFSQMFAKEDQKVLMITARERRRSTYCLRWTNQALFDSIQIIIMHTCAWVSSLNIHQR